jgi:hypothetical protein
VILELYRLSGSAIVVSGKVSCAVAEKSQFSGCDRKRPAAAGGFRAAPDRLRRHGAGTENAAVAKAETFAGSCLCEAVTFEVTPPTRWCVHCHCSLCQRAHGAPFVTWFGVGREQLKITRGEGVLRWRASSNHGRRAFCAECGTQLLFETARHPGQVDVVRACVPGPIDRQPSAHVHVASKADWVEIEDRLDRYPEDSASGNVDA